MTGVQELMHADETLVLASLSDASAFVRVVLEYKGVSLRSAPCYRLGWLRHPGCF